MNSLTHFCIMICIIDIQSIAFPILKYLKSVAYAILGWNTWLIWALFDRGKTTEIKPNKPNKPNICDLSASILLTMHNLLPVQIWKYPNKPTFMDHICPQLLYMQYLSNGFSIANAIKLWLSRMQFVPDCLHVICSSTSDIIPMN